MEKSTPEKGPQAPSSCSCPSSRRASVTYESLPTPPPDSQEMPTNSTETIFQYPWPDLNDLPAAFGYLLNYAEQEQEFYRTLNEVIGKNCPVEHAVESESETNPHSVEATINDDPKCHCNRMRQECEEFIAPFKVGQSWAITAALATYGAVEQLTRLYSLWDRYLDMEHQLRQQKKRLRYVNLLQEKLHSTDKDEKFVDPELDQSIDLLDTILESGNCASLKRSQLKRQRERSKSVVTEDGIDSTWGRMGNIKSSASCNYGPQRMRRQSTYSEGKSKVSKWTKVKAAFKWEKANVPAMNESNKEYSNAVGLTPINNEVARYLRVPSVPHGGGSSADSILSSSSGHFLSETGTPGTVSSASSVDDIDNTGRMALSRDSSKSDHCKLENEDIEFNAFFNSPRAESPFEIDNQKLLRSDSSKSNPAMPSKSSSNKSIRRSKVIPDFETLPENSIAEIKSTPSRRLKPPPSPLDLNLNQDLNEVDYFHSPYSLKSPKDGTQSQNRLRKIGSPGNSSVPSSPSRYSEFFPECESEDISSGDFSEPPSPSRKTFQEKQAEINQRYLLLRAKLDMEFEAKRREWEKMKANPNFARVFPRMTNTGKSEELSPNQKYNSNLSAKMLEENLSPDFKKKLRKWRVKKQISVQSTSNQPTVQPPPAASPSSPNKIGKDMTCETKTKIDWNLWKTGAIKLDGQGLMPLPEKKNLPEDFQKKLEQWNKIKSGSYIASGGGGDSLKRGSKHNESTKKSSDDDRCYLADRDKRSDKHKSHDKEKFPKLKAIVGDHPPKTKEIEVKTSAGVMKFEGISRKFTRKLYEWEKARGIGPESSTFALLHPGYCPLDVGRIPKDNKKTDNSPTLSRSLSLDSVPPNFTSPCVLSHQASSLSLNDMNELKSDFDGVSSSDALGDNEFKKFDEPEAVMVEVEDHIVETASPLITANTRVERQTPVYKYEEIACNDICNTRRIQSFESHTNLAPLLSALKRFDDIFIQLKETSPEIIEREELRRCQILISSIRNIYPYHTENLIKPNVLNAITDVQSELSRIAELCQKSPLDEACCQEIVQERDKQYNEEFDGLHESLKLLRQNIQGGKCRFPRKIIPDINITADDTCDELSLQNTICDTRSRDQLSTTLEATDELSASQVENDTETTTTTTTHTAVQRSFSNANGSIGKKKLRLRKIGSRQNSKTESSNTSDDDAYNAVETSRRLKRKNFRFKQRSFDDDYRRNDEPSTINEDARFPLKLKPLNSIEKRNDSIGLSKSCTKLTHAPRENFSQFLPTNGQTRLISSEEVEKELPNFNSNVFVKTRRKVFRTIEEPSAIDGIAVVAHDLDDNAAEETLRNKDDIITNGTTDKTESKGENRIKYVRESCSVVMWSKNNSTKPKRKSLSENDLRNISSNDCMEERRCHSLDNIKRITKNVRKPLATDSFKKINRNSNFLTRDESNSSGTQKRMELRFRKNPDLYFLQNSKVYNPRVAKKIESKFAKSNSSAFDESKVLEKNLDHNNQRIFERKSMTPTSYPTKIEFSTRTSPNPLNSAPTTPVQETQSLNKPCTPLSERAQRLQKAKEEFLQCNLPHHPKASFKRREQILRTKTWEQHRRSDHSISSTTTTTTTGADDHNGDVLKSASVNMIRGSSLMGDTTTQSDAGTDIDTSGGLYDSLPRSVSRSGKISSKLGFATLASKFRRSKGKDKSKESWSNDNAVSALCRQTLFADVPVAAPPYDVQQESVIKSQSTPQAHVLPSPSATPAPKFLNKSLSEQYVKHPKKESYV